MLPATPKMKMKLKSLGPLKKKFIRFNLDFIKAFLFQSVAWLRVVSTLLVIFVVAIFLTTFFIWVTEEVIWLLYGRRLNFLVDWDPQNTKRIVFLKGTCFGKGACQECPEPFVEKRLLPGMPHTVVRMGYQNIIHWEIGFEIGFKNKFMYLFFVIWFPYFSSGWAYILPYVM